MRNILFSLLCMSSLCAEDISSPQLASVRGFAESFCATFDSNQWKLVKHIPKEAGDEIIFCLGKNAAFGSLIAKKSDPSETVGTLQKDLLEKLKQTVMEIEILSEEERLLQGVPVHYVRLLGKTMGPTIAFDIYLSITSKCAVTFLVTTLSDRREKYEKEIFALLEGLQLYQDTNS